MYREVEQIITTRNIYTVFQPIFDVTYKQILGYEALTRGPKGSIYFAPDKLFQAAIELGLLSDLEMVCRENAIKEFARLNLPGKLFLNISPLVLLDQSHPQGETAKLVERSGMNCQQIVIELSEKYPYPDNNMLRLALDKYREFGFNVAIDDLGAGYSGLKQWSQLRPEIVKVDRYFVEQCHLDSFKHKFIKAIFELAKSADTLVVVEGIETEAEYDFLVSLGMRYAQGFYLDKPSKFPKRTFPRRECTLISAHFDKKLSNQ